LIFPPVGHWIFVKILGQFTTSWKAAKPLIAFPTALRQRFSKKIAPFYNCLLYQKKQL